MVQPSQPPVLQRPYVSFADSKSDVSKVMEDVSIIAVVIVVAVILIAAVSVTLLVRFLRGAVDAAGKTASSFECEVWLAQRRQSYLGGGLPPANPGGREALHTLRGRQ